MNEKDNGEKQIKGSSSSSSSSSRLSNNKQATTISLDVSEKTPVLNKKSSSSSSSSPSSHKSILWDYLVDYMVKSRAYLLGSSYYRRIDHILTYPQPVLTAIITILGAYDVASNPSSNKEYTGLTHSITIMAALTTLLMATRIVMKTEDKLHKHFLSATQYEELVGDIKLFLARKYSSTELHEFETIQHEKDVIYSASALPLPHTFVTTAKRLVSEEED